LRVEKLGSEELHASCSSPKITVVYKCRRIVWTRPGREANGIQTFIGTLEGKRPLRIYRQRWRIMNWC
jgi:hypothetical protein